MVVPAALEGNGGSGLASGFEPEEGSCVVDVDWARQVGIEKAKPVAEKMARVRRRVAGWVCTAWSLRLVSRFGARNSIICACWSG